jgi:hypothetical protein
MAFPVNNTHSFYSNNTAINEHFTDLALQDEDQILVVVQDMLGNQYYSKVVITDVDMVLSVFIVKDVYNKIQGGLYTVVSSSVNDLVSQKLIVQ